MSDFRYRPKGKYIYDADLQGIYILTEYWKNDLEFYRDDLRFLQHLIDKYFIWMTQKENLDDSHKFRTEHEELEDSIADFVKSFRSNRKKVFAITEHVMDSEKLNRLLKA